MFDVATRKKFRFETAKGLVTTEDLWDMPLTGKNGSDLDSVARSLNKKIKDGVEESFVIKSRKTNEQRDAELKFDIVMHIIEVKISEAEAMKDAKVRKEQKEELLRIIKEKEAETVKNKSIDELKDMVAELD